MIVEMDLYYEIRTRYNAGQSIRSIAKSLGIARQTVKSIAKAVPTLMSARIITGI